MTKPAYDVGIEAMVRITLRDVAAAGPVDAAQAARASVNVPALCRRTLPGGGAAMELLDVVGHIVNPAGDESGEMTVPLDDKFAPMPIYEEDPPSFRALALLRAFVAGAGVGSDMDRFRVEAAALVAEADGPIPDAEAANRAVVSAP